MPWVKTNPQRERRKFIEEYEKQLWSMTELCERFGVSRKTGYKYIQRYREEGLDGLVDRSRAPKTSPCRVGADVERLILAAKAKHRMWGARKIRVLLEREHPRLELPARSTIADVLSRHGLVKHKRRRRKHRHPGAEPLRTAGPNEVWPVDFKGQFRTQDGVYCYPLTITDHFSRYLLKCEGLPNVRTEYAKPVFERLFREVGLPIAIRSDNGAPFVANHGIHGLCALNVWWMKLGIVHQRIMPASPQENGTHERMHRTLKAETTMPAARTMKAQQVLFNRFRKEYNEERPHEALDDEVPSSLWESSDRRFPKRLAKPEYPGHFEVRRVSMSGVFRIASAQQFLSSALKGEYIGLEEVEDAIFNIFYFETLLARYDLRKGVLTS